MGFLSESDSVCSFFLPLVWDSFQLSSFERKQTKYYVVEILWLLLLLYPFLLSEYKIWEEGLSVKTKNKKSKEWRNVTKEDCMFERRRLVSRNSCNKTEHTIELSTTFCKHFQRQSCLLDVVLLLELFWSLKVYPLSDSPAAVVSSTARLFSIRWCMATHNIMCEAHTLFSTHKSQGKLNKKGNLILVLRLSLSDSCEPFVFDEKQKDNEAWKLGSLSPTTGIFNSVSSFPQETRCIDSSRCAFLTRNQVENSCHWIHIVLNWRGFLRNFLSSLNSFRFRSHDSLRVSNAF